LNETEVSTAVWETPASTEQILRIAAQEIGNGISKLEVVTGTEKAKIWLKC
jgi:hypothetical protein